MSFCCCWCDSGLAGVFYGSPQPSRTYHAPLSSSVVSTQAENRILPLYSAPLSPPIPLAISPEDLQTPQILPTTLSNSSEGARAITQAFTEKETSHVGDLADFDDVKKQDRETIDECPICLEEYDMENPRLLTKCGHDFHLACILDWMERSKACPFCNKELVLNES